MQKSPAAEKRNVADELPTQSESASPSIDIAVTGVCILQARVQPTLDPYAEAFL